MNTDEVASHLWGTVQAVPGARAQDVAQLGPAPRSIEPRMLEYTKRAVNSLAALWLILAIFFGLGDVMMFAMGFMKVPALTLLFVGLAIWSFRWRSGERARVLDTICNGQFVRVPITGMRAVERRGKYGQVLYVTYYVTFQLAHGPVTLVTKDPGVSMLQLGLSEEVLWSERNPDVVVPTYLLVT